MGVGHSAIVRKDYADRLLKWANIKKGERNIIRCPSSSGVFVCDAVALVILPSVPVFMIWSGCWSAEARVFVIVDVCRAIVDGVGGNFGVGAVLGRLALVLGSLQGPEINVGCDEG